MIKSCSNAFTKYLLKCVIYGRRALDSWFILAVQHNAHRLHDFLSACGLMYKQNLSLGATSTFTFNSGLPSLVGVDGFDCCGTRNREGL